MKSGSKAEEPWWTEQDSQYFIEIGRVAIPARDDIQTTILDLLPVAADEAFLAVELGVGSGWLSEAILERFPAARVLGLDPSAAMLEETGQRLQRFAGRWELRPFRLEDSSWLEAIGDDVGCFVSSLVVHHLSGDGKRALYHDLYRRLKEPGAVIIADLVAPASEWERRYMADRWDAEVERQSIEFTGSRDVYLDLMQQEWNWYRWPDPMDMPSTVPEHLTWLREAGFSGVNVFWERAGHAVYGGYTGEA